MEKVFVLNNSYECISTCSLCRALSLIEQKKAEVVKYSNSVIKTVSKIIQIPLIIKIFRFIRVYCRRLHFSNKLVWERDNYICQYCEKEIKEKKDLTADHVFPKSRGGKTTFENMVTACLHCNRKKNNRTPQEVNMHPIKKPVKPTMSKKMKEILAEISEIIKEL